MSLKIPPLSSIKHLMMLDLCDNDMIFNAHEETHKSIYNLSRRIYIYTSSVIEPCNYGECCTPQVLHEGDDSFLSESLPALSGPVDLDRQLALLQIEIAARLYGCRQIVLDTEHLFEAHPTVEAQTELNAISEAAQALGLDLVVQHGPKAFNPEL